MHFLTCLLKKECDRALQRIEDEQERMRLFKEDVKSKFGDLMDGDGLLEDDEDDDNYGHNNNGNKWNDGLGGFKLDGDDSQITYDEPEPEWNNNRQPRVKYPNIQNAGVIQYNAPEMSHTHNIGSLPSRSMKGPPQVINDPENNTLNSMMGVNKNSVGYDASLQSDLIGRKNMGNNNSLNNNNNNSQQTQDDSQSSGSRRSFV